MIEKNETVQQSPGREASEHKRLVIGPPTPGPVVRISGRGVSLDMRVDDELDEHILNLHLRLAQRRRFGFDQ